MNRSGGVALQNVVIERDMPRGYTWAKIRNCWTSDLEDARFLAPDRNSNTGEMMPAALFTSIIAYDPTSGYIERDVKFQGCDAEAMVMHQADSNILRINADGHISTRVINTPEGQIARSIIFIKEGSVQILEVCPQTPRHVDTDTGAGMTLEEYANRKMREIEPVVSKEQQASEARALELLLGENADQSIWPGLTEYDANVDLDEAPF